VGLSGTGGPGGAAPGPPAVSVIIVNFEGGDDLLRCLASLERQSGVAEVVLVDNGSEDGSCRRALALHPAVRVVGEGANRGFAGGANLGAAHAHHDVLLFLNPDVRLEDGCVAELARALVAPVAVAGPVLAVESSGAREHGGTINHLGMPMAIAQGAMPLYVSGCALATLRDTFVRLGGFDQRYFLFVEDVEYCWRALNAGGDVVVAPAAAAWHRGGGSAPGGYLHPGRAYVTSELRIALRERNTVAMMLACAPWWWLPVVIPALVVRGLVLAAVSVGLRRPALARSLVGGLGWNARQLPASWGRRRASPRLRAGERAGRRRVVRRALLLRTLLAHGLPRIARGSGG